MPIYDYQCLCGKEKELYQPLTTSEAPTCECGLGMEKVLRTRKHIPGNIYPFVTSNITGKPVEVTSAAHLDRLCKENNVVHRPDAAWIEQRYEGVDFRTGKQRYVEGSGRGLPGSWV